jgi:hypothetical protein
MIKFTDFIKSFTEGKDLSRIKVKLNISDEQYPALDLLYNEKNSKNDSWYHMNAWKKENSNHKLEKYDYLITFAQYYYYGDEFFLFGGIYKVEKIFPEKFNDVGYNLTLLDDFKEYRKRLIIKIKKKVGRTYNRIYNNIDNDLIPEVYEISPSMNLKQFNGYQNVSLTYTELQYIINNTEPSWKLALSSVKAVYVITDTSNGELYIGSAYGTGGLLNRWNEYINNLTGGNKKFEELVAVNGKEYIQNNFKYSILEIFDTKTKDEYIVERENYWKNVFETRNFGMNWN